MVVNGIVKKNKLPSNSNKWIAGEIEIKSYREDEKDVFEVCSYQKDGSQLTRKFGSKKSARKFCKKLEQFRKWGRKGCRECGGHTLMGEDFCSDHI